MARTRNTSRRWRGRCVPHEYYSSLTGRKFIATGRPSQYNSSVKRFDWNPDKNDAWRNDRGVTFEEVVYHLAHGGLLDVIQHPNKERYGGQRLFIVNVEGYAHIVPFVESDDTVFLKTIIPSRKMTKKYLGGE